MRSIKNIQIYPINKLIVLSRVKDLTQNIKGSMTLLMNIMAQEDDLRENKRQLLSVEISLNF